MYVLRYFSSPAVVSFWCLLLLCALADAKLLRMESTSTVAQNIDAIKEKIQNALKDSDKTSYTNLVAVTKRIKKDLIRQAYDHGERHFGENYFQSLKRRSVSLPSDIKWHFIGHLQSNKAKGLAEIENLHVVETVDSLKLAQKLDNACASLNKTLNIFLQINSSGEDTKSGLPPTEVMDIVDKIMNEHKNLNLTGRVFF